MEIQYQNNKADIRAYYEYLWRDRKAAHRTAYYLNAFWDFAILGLAIYVALRCAEIIAILPIAILGASYVVQNWSFAYNWRKWEESSLNEIPETSCSLLLDESGVNESFSGVKMHVPWSQIQDYAVHEDRLFIHFLKYRAFIIPLGPMSIALKEELIKTLESHNVRKRVA